ncbi:MAG: hypothetical protein KAI79_04985 [Bacteroidales bacterium]|nr:hypothetical protein [Bacteroidales bacterium]
MNHNIYNLHPAIVLSSGINIHLQSISLSHTYGGLLCNTPSEQINNNVISEIREKFEKACFIIKPRINMISEYDFFDKGDHYSKEKTIPLLSAVKVEALFECYKDEESTFLNIIWFQDGFSETISSSIENKIQDIDWHRYAKKFSL